MLKYNTCRIKPRFMPENNFFMAGQNCAFFETKFVLSFIHRIDAILVDALAVFQSHVLSIFDVGFVQKLFSF